MRLTKSQLQQEVLKLKQSLEKPEALEIHILPYGFTADDCTSERTELDNKNAIIFHTRKAIGEIKITRGE